MIRKRRVLAGVLAVVTTTLLTAGAGGAGQTGSGASGDPVAGGTAVVLVPSELRTLDPALTGNNGSSGAVIGNALYGTLLVNDPKTGDVKPSMATEFKTTDGGATF